MTTVQAPTAPAETHPVSAGEFLAWDGDRLVVTDPDQLKKVNRPRLSASTAKAIESCPARYVSDKTFPGVNNPFHATDLGTAAHAVLERLYTLPATGRSRLAAARATLALAEEVDFAAHFGDPSSAAVAKAQWIATVTEYYSGIWEIEDPTTVMVRRNEWPVNQVEVAGVPFIGFIDRTDVVVDEDGVMGSVPVDYKGLATDTPIPTPTGWTTMGELREGDRVLGADGHPTTVVGKSSTFHRPCYEVTFSDGASVVADNVHLWQVTEHRLGRGDPGTVVVDTDELYRRHRRCRRSLHTHTLRIANTAPLQLPECDMAGTDLYELGFSLGRDPQPDVAGGDGVRAGLRGSPPAAARVAARVDGRSRVAELGALPGALRLPAPGARGARGRTGGRLRHHHPRGRRRIRGGVLADRTQPVPALPVGCCGGHAEQGAVGGCGGAT